MLSMLPKLSKFFKNTLIRFRDMILKHVQTCHNAFDAIWYDSQTCLILFRINMIRIDAILKYVKTWRNTQKLSKWYMKRNWKSYSLDRFDERAVKNNYMDQVLCSLPLSFNVFLKVEKVEFSAQYSDLENLCWWCKNSPVSFD